MMSNDTQIAELTSQKLIIPRSAYFQQRESETQFCEEKNTSNKPIIC